MELIVNFDGSCGPCTGGTAAWGCVIRDEDSVIIQAGSGCVGTGPGMTNNVAEYEGLYQAMMWVSYSNPTASALFKGDSQMVINQMNGWSKAKKGAYIPYYMKSAVLAYPFIQARLWEFQWIPREMNTYADNLSQYWRFNGDIQASAMWSGKVGQGKR